MHNCSSDIVAYHDDKVTLPQVERTEMRKRRDTNRDRLRNGLKKNEKPTPKGFATQGSYAMKTMVQHSWKNYDIDDGVYFNIDDLKGPNGGEMSAIDARKMVRDAVDDGSFKTPPEVRTNCVRVYYEVGYHVDIPVYRHVVSKDEFGNEDELYELASSEWKRADARDVTKWFEDENTKKSPDKENGRQLRRITRLIKKFANSRPSWEDQILSGFGITKLITERYSQNQEREDKALYYTMEAIRDRLALSLVIKHPVTPNGYITKGNDDPKARFLRERLSDAIGWLNVLFDSECTDEKALAAWDKVFFTEYFSGRAKKRKVSEGTSSDTVGPAILTSGLLKDLASSEGVRAAVQKKGGDHRYA